ncbi:MAG: NAD-dependent epimerase/dehydratase family protein [Desulfosarcina sp.]|nr:NAD-dependent epimerase/dehydratase family protein [Desulfobacterales bacterium]
MASLNLSDKPVLVTGGGGFLGGAIVRLLLGKGIRVRSFSRRHYPALDALGVEQVQGDIAHLDAVLAATAGVDLVFHVAAKPGIWGDYQDYHRPNVIGTENVLQACREHGVHHLVYTSSPSVVFNGQDMAGVDESVPYPGHWDAHYPQTKALAEQMVLQAGRRDLSTIALRPHLIWGPGDNHLAPRIIRRAKRLRKIGPGRNRVDTIYIDNAAHAHLLAAENLIARPELSGRVYFISQDEPIVLWEMIDAILAAADLPPVKRSLSAPAARCIGTLSEWLYRTFRLPGEPPMTRFVADELASAHWFDIGAAKRDLGYRPLVSTQEGLHRLRHWLQTKNKPTDASDTNQVEANPRFP